MRSLILAAILAFSAPAFAEEEAAPGAPPEWFLAEIEMLAKDGGRWITDNAAYKSDQEKYDQYGMEWKASFDGMSAKGRLFGIIDGEEIADFWEFRNYWHPGRKESVLEQFGWGGVIGVGSSKLMKDGSTKAHQTFYGVDGSERLEGHISSFPDGNTHITTSYDAADNDNWVTRRTYTWKREVAAQPD